MSETTQKTMSWMRRGRHIEDLSDAEMLALAISNEEQASQAPGRCWQPSWKASGEGGRRRSPSPIAWPRPSSPPASRPPSLLLPRSRLRR